MTLYQRWMMSGECTECGNHTLECNCDYTICEKCAMLKVRGDDFCIQCLIAESRELIKRVDEKYGKYYG